MASNPMQKKARNSFLLGMIISLIIFLVIGVLFYVVVMRKDMAKEKTEGTVTYTYRLSKDIKSGEKITTDKVEAIQVTSKAVPAGAFASKTKDTSTGKWIDQSFPDGMYKSKLDLKAGTILASDLVYEDEKLTADVRYVEYNMLVLSTKIAVGDYIDIRLTLPNGQDLIVVSKKEVKSIINNTLGLELSEGEILMMESAIVESYIMTSSKLYATQYIEPGDQEAAEKTYVPTTEVQGLIERNPNIKNEAREELQNRFNADVRTWTNNSKNAYVTEEQENLETKLQEEIENAKAAREAYLAGLNGNNQ